MKSRLHQQKEPPHPAGVPRPRRILLGAAYSSIEPLGLLYLAGLARDLGWDAHIRLVRDGDFHDFHEAVRDLKPEIVGYTLYTGNHVPLYDYFSRLKQDFPQIRTVIGGPHATYFPVKCRAFADNVVVSEGFDALRRILSEAVGEGILYPTRLMAFPQPQRRRFYQDYPEHWRNPIKNVISMTGCPFACTYCYNSSSIEGTMGSQLPPEEVARIKAVLGHSGRLFPMNCRTPQAVLQEIREVLEVAPQTRLMYWQDDTLGIGQHAGFLREFSRLYDHAIPFHGQTRFEMLNPKTERGVEVLRLLQEIGYTGMTMAIEAADDTIRKEVLNRVMPTELMFDVCQALGAAGIRLRTEQITGLPYGATTRETSINLAADMELLRLNLNLRRATGLPNISWATTLIPYMGTGMSDYCIRYGFITPEAALNPEAGYHERSVLRHVKRYVGPSLLERKDDPDVWLSYSDQERYRDQNTQLRYNFHILAYLSGFADAETLVERHLQMRREFSTATLNADVKEYIYGHASEAGRRLREKIQAFENAIPPLTPDARDQERLRHISAYCAILPGDGAELARRYLRYSNGKDDVALLSNIVKKYLFDTQLYLQEECTCELYDGAIVSGGADAGSRTGGVCGKPPTVEHHA